MIYNFIKIDRFLLGISAIALFNAAASRSNGWLEAANKAVVAIADGQLM
jgi:hypothetical protein